MENKKKSKGIGYILMGITPVLVVIGFYAEVVWFGIHFYEMFLYEEAFSLVDWITHISFVFLLIIHVFSVIWAFKRKDWKRLKRQLLIGLVSVSSPFFLLMLLILLLVTYTVQEHYLWYMIPIALLGVVLFSFKIYAIGIVSSVILSLPGVLLLKGYYKENKISFASLMMHTVMLWMPLWQIISMINLLRMPKDFVQRPLVYKKRSKLILCIIILKMAYPSPLLFIVFYLLNPIYMPIPRSTESTLFWILAVWFFIYIGWSLFMVTYMIARRIRGKAQTGETLVRLACELSLGLSIFGEMSLLDDYMEETSMLRRS